jgi:glycosyltransferase involved in cell wall biosynthesis
MCVALRRHVLFIWGGAVRVVVCQYRLLHYRVELFERLRVACARRGIEFTLVHGQASRREQAKRDEGSLDWAHPVRNRFLALGERDLVWQPMPADLRNADLVVVMQENRILSNYPLLLSRLWSKRRLAYWGHGRNYQSHAPTGLRERWKNWLLTKVDWWFAYTDMTVQLLRDAGYPPDRITSLENAIDTDGFKRDLASWSQADVDDERNRLGIAADAPVALFCGSLYLDKRLELMVAAADWIRERRPDFSFIVIGNGPSMTFVQSAAATRPWLKVLGVRKGRDKALAFRLADVMFNPGLVGLHIVDAFCSGLVLATTRTARHSPEVAYLRDGENGLITGDNPAEYGQEVLGVINSPERLQAMRAAALRDSERYTLDNMVNRFADGIEAALRHP